MGRWTDDDSCVPSGMQRIGYDSDTQRYKFRDSDGSIYEGGTYGGDLILVSRPTMKTKQDDEPIRLMPNSPTRSSHTSTASPTTPTSPMSFRDFLPPDAMTGATPQEPPRRRVTMKMPTASPLQRSQTTPGRDAPQRSLWNVVRSKTVPTKMRDVVQNVVRRSSNSKDQPPKDRRYERLSGDSSSRTSHSPSRHSKQATA